MKATECLGEIMSDGHIDIPENEKQHLNRKVGRKIRVILFGEAATGDNMLKRLQDRGLIKAPMKETIKPLNQRRFVRIRGERMAETVIKLRGEK